MKYIIGISAFYHDSSACLFKDGRLIFACEEEKFSGIKHDSSFPTKTLEYIFKIYNIKKEDIEAVCYYEDPILKMERVYKNISNQFFKNPKYAIQSYFEIKKNTKRIKKLLSQISNNIFYSKHHLSHQYYSFYTSTFNQSICLSLDGVGEYDTMSFGYADESDIKYTSMAEYPHSIGLFYSAMTAFLGFQPNDGEYKVMGLAAYGDSSKYINKLRELIEYKNSKLTCNMNYFIWNKSKESMFNEKLCDFLGLELRLPNEPILQKHKDLAAAIQLRYEEVLKHILHTISNISYTDNICLSGGCAYNGLANVKIIKESFYNQLWIPVAPSDAGSSIGACVHYLVKNKKLKERVTKNPFLGPQYFYNDVYTAIKDKKIYKFLSEERMLKYVAKNLNDGKIIGWFQGHAEFGQRALGNRSILANPFVDGIKNKINETVKNREMFRPLAPMVKSNVQSEYFEIDMDIPYMNQIVKVKESYVDLLKEVSNVDGTARVQTVHKHTLVYHLLNEFEKLSGHPILLNTSFNIKGNPIVLTPKDAVATFFKTDIDLLIIGNYVIYKD
jgi:carbamoyltransferase